MKSDIRNIVEHSVVSEKAIERYLCLRVAEKGGICLKYSNPNQAGYPDRVIILPKGKTIWVELKSKGQHPSKIQLSRFAKMEALEHKVYICDCMEDVDEIMKRLKD
jgi:hypothetical protein